MSALALASLVALVAQSLPKPSKPLKPSKPSSIAKMAIRIVPHDGHGLGRQCSQIIYQGALYEIYWSNDPAEIVVEILRNFDQDNHNRGWFSVVGGDPRAISTRQVLEAVGVPNGCRFELDSPPNDDAHIDNVLDTAVAEMREVGVFQVSVYPPNHLPAPVAPPAPEPAPVAEPVAEPVARLLPPLYMGEAPPPLAPPPPFGGVLRRMDSAEDYVGEPLAPPGTGYGSSEGELLF